MSATGAGLGGCGMEAGTRATIAVWDTGICVGAWRSLVARTVRVGEVPSSNLGAPIRGIGPTRPIPLLAYGELHESLLRHHPLDARPLQHAVEVLAQVRRIPCRRLLKAAPARE